MVAHFVLLLSSFSAHAQPELRTFVYPHLLTDPFLHLPTQSPSRMNYPSVGVMTMLKTSLMFTVYLPLLHQATIINDVCALKLVYFVGDACPSNI